MMDFAGGLWLLTWLAVGLGGLAKPGYAHWQALSLLHDAFSLHLSSCPLTRAVRIADDHYNLSEVVIAISTPPLLTHSSI